MPFAIWPTPEGMPVAFTVARNTHKLRIKDLNSIKALTPSSLSFEVSLDQKAEYPKILFYLLVSRAVQNKSWLHHAP